MDRMVLYIRNNREEIIATIVIENGVLVEEELDGCWLKDIDSGHYKIDLLSSPETIENFSNESLLNEIRARMHQ